MKWKEKEENTSLDLIVDITILLKNLLLII
jgi:hypothetical protein